MMNVLAHIILHIDHDNGTLFETRGEYEYYYYNIILSYMTNKVAIILYQIVILQTNNIIIKILILNLFICNLI